VISEALGQLLWEEFLNSWTDDIKATAETVVEDLVNTFLTVPHVLQDKILHEPVQKLLKTFFAFVDERCSENPTFKFWVSYLNFFVLLQQFVLHILGIGSFTFSR